MKYSQVTAFLNLLSDSRLRKALHASAFIEAPARRGFAIGERISTHINHVFDTRDRSRSTAAMSPEAVRYMTQPLPTRRFKEALARVQLLFMETNGVKLTTADAALMAGLDQQVCGVMLQNLIEAGFLEQRRGGVFVRKSDTPSIRR